MQFSPIDPPRTYEVGFGETVTIADCGSMNLDPNEQITFCTATGAEYDVTRKEWGFYATPSLNGRLTKFGLRSALVRNRIGHYFVLLVERGQEPAFERYLTVESLVVVAWLDNDAVLQTLETCLGGKD